MTIILDRYTIPEHGVLQIKESITINVSAAEAQRKVNHWLFTQVSYMLAAGTPTLVIGERVVWHVPAILTAAHVGEVDEVGSIDVDVLSGEVYDATAQREALLERASLLIDNLPPYQPHAEVSPEYLAEDIEFAVTQPEGDPHTIIANARRSDD